VFSRLAKHGKAGGLLHCKVLMLIPKIQKKLNKKDGNKINLKVLLMFKTQTGFVGVYIYIYQ
jgi:hypothetical protein